MESMKKKALCGLYLVIIHFSMLMLMYGHFTDRYYQPSNSSPVSLKREHGGKILPDRVFLGYGSEPNLNVTKQLRLISGIQMSEDQIIAIRKVLPMKGNLLVWGLGNDSPYWHNSTSGRVVFIEDDIPLKKAGILWFDKITKQYPFLEAYKVHYSTDTVKSFAKYINRPNIWYDLDLSDQLPASLLQTHWHVIIVDAPLGCCQRGPGRYQSIYTSKILAREGTHVFVDDFERKVEHEFSFKLLGKPLEVIKRRATKASLANEQAHFIIVERTKIPHEVSPKPDKVIEPKTEYGTTDWTILLTVNDGFFDFFQNWLWYFKRLHIQIPIFVIAEDSTVYAKLNNLKDISINVQRSGHISINTSTRYRSSMYNKMVSTRPTYILMFLKTGTNIIYSDIDTVWMKNPLPFLEGNFDIAGQLDQKHIICTGFMAIQNNEKSMNLIQKWEDALKAKPSVNQPIFNVLLKNSSLNVKELDMKRFPPGNYYFKRFSAAERSEVVVVHNNWIVGHDKKLKRFKNMKLWFNGTLP